ncbi:Outer membrane pore protein E precursor [Marinomonas spartinae]|uniref:porin n=1 Tax=Marinomonas spartinae TaxID=1792290 RepID=UPI000808DE90|nr:porin [Marinomonas spartinae]SBS29958.1 Outer membrane pore protein E precursor [Marinomonas spartinae]
MKKTILALAITSATLATAAHAATVYNADGSKLDVYGRVEADMTHAGAAKDSTKAQADTKGELTTSARIGIKGETRVNDNFNLFAKGEWQVAGQNSDGTKFDARKVYFGLDFKKDGTVTIGQQDTPLYTSLVQTVDIFDQWGMEAQKGIYGHDRQASQVVYANSFGNLDVQAGYQFRNSDGKSIGSIAPNTVQDNAYSAAAVYHTGMGLNLRAAYANQNFGSAGGVANGNSDGKINTYGLGADYTLNNLYLAFVYLGSKTDNGAGANSDTKLNSYDLVGAYTIDQYRIYTGYGFQKKDPDGAASQDTIKSYKLGVEYNITSNALAWVEYRHNNADGTNDGANGFGENEVALSGQYNF